MFSCNMPPALLEEWPGSFMCYRGSTGGGGGGGGGGGAPIPKKE